MLGVIGLRVKEPMVTTMIWSCPNCKAELIGSGDLWSCSNGHSFDVAREGYVNLLPAHHKHSRTPGDPPEMVMARRRLLATGLYEPLANTITELLAKRAVTSLLDIGCGEGYYDGLLTSGIRNLDLFGVDIAKPAVRIAAKAFPGHQYAVASNSRLPVMDNIVDAVLKVFAPSNDAETLRVLKPEAFYLEVGPSNRHLWELRAALYDTPFEHKPLRNLLAGATLLEHGVCAYTRELSHEQINDLVLATPFAHRGHREKRQRLVARASMIISIEFGWRLYQKDRPIA